MAISITVNSASGTSFDVNSYLQGLTGGFSSSNRGVFYDGGSDDNVYQQYALDSNGTTAGGDSFIASGDLTYNFGALDGSLDTLSFGTSLNYTYPGSGVESTTEITLGAGPVLVLDGLGLNDSSQAGGTGDDVHDVLYGMMTGNSTPLETYLAANDIEFQGGAGNDTFVSGAGADLFLVSAGGDTYTGGSGVDTYDFGDVANAGGALTTTILDFTDDVDVIDLGDLGLDEGAVEDAMTETGGDVVIDLAELLSLGDDTLIVVENTTSSALLDDIIV